MVINKCPVSILLYQSFLKSNYLSRLVYPSLLLYFSEFFIPSLQFALLSIFSYKDQKSTLGGMELKGMTLDHDHYVVVGQQCHTENA